MKIGWLLKIFVVLGVNEYRGSLGLSMLLKMFRMIVVFTLGLMLFVLVVRGVTPSDIPPRAEVEEAVKKWREKRDGVALGDVSEFEATDIDIIVRDSDGTSDGAIGIIGSNKDLFYTVEMVCTTCNGGTVENPGAKQELFSIKPVFTELVFAQALGTNVAWPFIQTEFSAGPYVLSALALDAAQTRATSQGAGPLDKEKKDTIKLAVDGISSGLPTPSDPELAVARRLLGPIQFACYGLFAFGLLNLLLTYMSTVAPNIYVRGFTSVRLRGETLAKTGDDFRLQYEEGLKETDAPEIAVPWSPNNHIIGGSTDFERFYAKLYRKIASTISIGGILPVIPLIELRRIGYMAFQSDTSGTNVPSFIVAQTDSFFEVFEAQSKTVQFLIWAIPTLGFVGTVVGIGNALLSTVDIQSAVASTKSVAESSVGSSIGTAFDTTFVALLLSFVLMILYYGLQKAQESMLAQEKRSAMEEIIHPHNIKTPMNVEHMQDFARIVTDALGQVQQAQQNGQVDPLPPINPVYHEAAQPPSLLRGMMFIIIGIGIAAVVVKWFPAILTYIEQYVSLLGSEPNSFS